MCHYTIRIISQFSCYLFFIFSLFACGTGENADSTTPIITLIGADTVTLEQGTVYLELGCMVVNDVDGQLQVTTSGSVDTLVPGTYELVYTVTSADGESVTVTRTVIITADATPPLVTLFGESDLTLEQGSVYDEAGAYAADNLDGDVEVSISGSVDSLNTGGYELTYSATDASGNTGTATRNVTIISDATPPVVTLNGASTLQIEQGANYVEAGASAVDDIDGNIHVVISGAVEASTVGSYELSYSATDRAGNMSIVIREVNVTPDITPPEVRLNGQSEVTVGIRRSYNELDATATDIVDGVLNVSISGSVNTQTEGTYVLTYSATDTAGNTGTATRSVIVAELPFITVWKTDNAGVSEDNQIQIQTYGGENMNYSYTVEWGDGTYDHAVSGRIPVHTYSTPSTYTVKIYGEVPGIFFGGLSDSDKILSVEQWGTLQWSSMNAAFQFCENLVINATDAPDLSGVYDMSNAFNAATSINQPIGHWDVSNVHIMDGTFEGATAFDQDIADWNVSNVTNMLATFAGASAFNQDIGAWNVSNVTDMSYMFWGAITFNQDIGDWDVSEVTDMTRMFWRASAFNQDIGRWDVQKVELMEFMFDGASSFNQYIGDWNVGSVSSMRVMFRDAIAFNQDIGSWSVVNVTNMNSMFAGATAFDQYIGDWEVSNVNTMAAMFAGAASFNQDIGGWNVANVTDMSAMFAGASAFNQDIGDWIVLNVTDMSATFSGASAFNQDVSNWNTVSVEYMGEMFRGATAFDQSLAGWDVTSVVSMARMFQDVTLSTAKYDVMLWTWSLQDLQFNVIFDGGNSRYSPAGEIARDNLFNNFNWTITDGGLAPAL